jgi:predicted RNase H-like HicB family nuclease
MASEFFRFPFSRKRLNMATSKNLRKSKARHSNDPRRPFSPEILHRAQKLAGRYQVVVWRDEEEKEFFGRGVELPLAMGDGRTADECIRSTREAFVAVLATLLEAGLPTPSPALEGKRDQQVNIRLTSDERLVLEAAARRSGFTGVSDFVRTAALAGAKN